MGGSDEPSNLIELSVKEHAEAHRLLFEQYGKWQDEVAWKALSGQIDKSEINYIISVLQNLGENNPMYGKPSPMRGKKHTAESKQKIKDSLKNIVRKPTSIETKIKIGLAHKGKTISDEHKKLIVLSNKNRLGEKRNTYKNKGLHLKKIECPYCNKIGGISAMERWHFDKCKLKGNI
jgi:hypothetical protein